MSPRARWRSAQQQEGEACIRDVYTVSATIAGKLQRISLHPGDAGDQGRNRRCADRTSRPGVSGQPVARGGRGVGRSSPGRDGPRPRCAQLPRPRLRTSSWPAKPTARSRAKGAISQRSYDTSVREHKTAQAVVSSALANLAVREAERAGSACRPAPGSGGRGGQMLCRGAGPWPSRAASCGCCPKANRWSNPHAAGRNRRSVRHGNRGRPSVPGDAVRCAVGATATSRLLGWRDDFRC